ncbi:MAG: hypothetical protein J6X65_06580 [Bacteroidales bacterium]|nr:hypothetical protein [Bacteroidales bacterium]
MKIKLFIFLLIPYISTFSQVYWPNHCIDSIRIDYISMTDFYFAQVTPCDFDNMITHRDSKKIIIENDTICLKAEAALSKLQKKNSANGLDVRRRLILFCNGKSPVKVYISQFYVFVNDAIYIYSDELKSIIEPLIEDD